MQKAGSCKAKAGYFLTIPKGIISNCGRFGRGCGEMACSCNIERNPSVISQWLPFKKYLPFLQEYATLSSKHYFKSGMAIRAAYLSNIRFFIRSGKFMLLFYPLFSIRAGVPACNTHAVILLQTKKEESYGRKQRVQK